MNPVCPFPTIWLMPANAEVERRRALFAACFSNDGLAVLTL